MSYFSRLKDKIKKIPIHIWILAAIVLVGIFLRTYNFHDWMRFSRDQSRDAFIISNVIEGKEKLPLLGPLAGGTEFYLGPAYYYFSFVSAKMFGNYPDKMAYPSLFFSILAIPLMYFFLKEYFSRKNTLMLTVIMSVSYFCVLNSRFSSNPNLAPFFVLLFLYALLKMLGSGEKILWRWPVLVGLALGIGVQIHTTLLAIMPIVSLVMFFYLLKKMGWGKIYPSLILVVAIALAMNASQVVHEFNTGAKNTKAFFEGVEDQKKSKSSTLKKIGTLLVCQAKTNAHIVASIKEAPECSDKMNFDLKKGSKELYPEEENKYIRKTIFILNFSFVIIFFISGYGLLWYYLKKEKDPRKQNFLRIIALYNAVSLLILLPVVDFISINYFIIIFFVPFIFLGLLFQLFSNKLNNYGKIIGIVLAIILVALSLGRNIKEADIYERGLNNNKNNSDLRIAEEISAYLIGNSSAEKIYFSGEKEYLERYAQPVKYIASRSGKEVIPVDINDVDEDVDEEYFFYIKNHSLKTSGSIRGYERMNSEMFYMIDIYILKK